MHRWKSILLNQWRAKLASLVVAALVWLVLRHAMIPTPANPIPPEVPAPAQPR